MYPSGSPFSESMNLKTPSPSSSIPMNSFQNNHWLSHHSSHICSPLSSYVFPPFNLQLSPTYNTIHTPASEPTPITSFYTFPNESMSDTHSLYNNRNQPYESVTDILDDLLPDKDSPDKDSIDSIDDFNDLNDKFIGDDMKDTVFFSDKVTITTLHDKVIPTYQPLSLPSPIPFKPLHSPSVELIFSNSNLSHQCPYPECSKIYTRAYTLKLHISASHHHLKPFECTHNGCEQKFARKHDLIRHCKTHLNERLFECQDCNRKFRRKDHLMMHIRGSRCKRRC